MDWEPGLEPGTYRSLTTKSRLQPIASTSCAIPRGLLFPEVCGPGWSRTTYSRSSVRHFPVKLQALQAEDGVDPSTLGL